jgi:hypothetical protein
LALKACKYLLCVVRCRGSRRQPPSRRKHHNKSNEPPTAKTASNSRRTHKRINPCIDARMMSNAAVDTKAVVGDRVKACFVLGCDGWKAVDAVGGSEAVVGLWCLLSTVGLMASCWS